MDVVAAILVHPDSQALHYALALSDEGLLTRLAGGCDDRAGGPRRILSWLCTQTGAESDNIASVLLLSTATALGFWVDPTFETHLAPWSESIKRQPV